MVFASVVCSEVLYKLSYNLLKGNGCAMTCIAIVGSIVSFFYTEIGLVALPCSLELVLKLFPFFIVGKLLALRLIEIGNKKHNKRKCALLGGILIVITCIIGGVAPPVNYNNNSFPIPVVFYVVATLGCIGMYGVSVSIQNTYWLNLIGKKTLPVLVLHKFPIVLFQITVPFRKLLQEPDSLKSLLLGGIPVTVIAIVMSLIAGYLVEKYCPFLLGSSKRVSDYEIIKYPR